MWEWERKKEETWDHAAKRKTNFKQKRGERKTRRRENIEQWEGEESRVERVITGAKKGIRDMNRRERQIISSNK